MSFAPKTLTGAVIAFSAMAGSTLADNAGTVQAFYNLLSNPGSQASSDAFVAATADTWESVGDYSGKNKSRDAFLGQVGGFAKLIPDLNWAVQDMHEDGNFVTVRSRATGTPVAPFFGVDGQGRSFDIMTIDIHEVVDGKIVRSYHVEDWAGALQQLSGR
ncbi:ester cyclase [uncultured Tateyamaria sp.]|uniref:ester cyclase n=1 Tax=uncultured Tateyamaria sp. TaxID=455651 RepID=UPI002614A79E|nr:ester cyclase [uncultured Tateyamaria sp.]